MADLLTPSDLASFLQRDLDTSTAVIAQKAQGLVRRYARQNFDSRTYTSVGLTIRPATGPASAPRATRIPSSGVPYMVVLPQRPVTAIASVVVAGQTLTRDVDWAWDGASARIDLGHVPLPATSMSAWPLAFVTYTAGYATIPDDVITICLAVAGRMYDNPRGLRSVSVDDYSGGYAGRDDDLAGVTLLAAERELLRPFRGGARTVGP